MFVIAGPCVIESEEHALCTGEALAGIAARLGIRLIYKSSFDKANRSSGASPRGPGLEEGLAKAAAVLPAEAPLAGRLWLCERGTSFGYRDLVTDIRGLETMRGLGCPVVFDPSHTVQQPGAAGTTSGGRRERIPVLARTAVAPGIDGLFIETHPDPARALSDAATVRPLDRLETLLAGLLAIDAAARPLWQNGSGPPA